MSVWIISVGKTDIQVPCFVAEEDDLGRVHWKRHLTRLPDGGLRAIHEALERLAQRDQVAYETQLAREYQPSEGESPPKLVLAVDDADDGFQAEYDHPAGAVKRRFRLSAGADTLPSAEATRLPVVLPKLEPCLILPASPKEGGTRAVIVLNTRRASGPREPVAAGPLVAQRMAQALGLRWAVRGDPCEEGQLPLPGYATSVNVVCDNETLDADPDHDKCRNRVLALCEWIDSNFPEEDIILSDSGGAQQVTQIVRRTIQAYFGEKRIAVLKAPEGHAGRGERPDARVQPLGAMPDWYEREQVRVAVARAIRERRLVVAYGLARSVADLVPDLGKADPWVRHVLGTLGPLCALPVPSGCERSNLSGALLLACQCEGAFLQKDMKTALILLGTLFEVIFDELLSRHPRFDRDAVGLDDDMKTIRFPGPEVFDQFFAEGFGILTTQPDYKDQLRTVIYLSSIQAKKKNVGRVVKNVSGSLAWLDWMVRQAQDEKNVYCEHARSLRSMYSTYAKSGLRDLRNEAVHERLASDLIARIDRGLQAQKSRFLVARDDGRLSLFAFAQWRRILTYITSTKIGDAHLEGILDGLLEMVRDPRSMA